jgi:hypothetical protein
MRRFEFRFRLDDNRVNWWQHKHGYDGGSDAILRRRGVRLTDS